MTVLTPWIGNSEVTLMDISCFPHCSQAGWEQARESLLHHHNGPKWAWIRVGTIEGEIFTSSWLPPHSFSHKGSFYVMSCRGHRRALPAGDRHWQQLLHGIAETGDSSRNQHFQATGGEVLKTFCHLWQSHPPAECRETSEHLPKRKPFPVVTNSREKYPWLSSVP